MYTHWLPLSPSSILGMEYDSDKIENSWEDILKSKYKEFDTLVHVTHIDKAATIFQENKLRSNPFRDNSVFSKVPGHPNEATKVIWFGPTMKRDVRQNGSRYGNVAFFMHTLKGWEGIRRDPGNWNYYFVEVIDYVTQSACRILVTHNKYEHLKPYDPTVKGGPWYYDQANGKDYWLTDVVRWDGTYGRNGNSLEIMREGCAADSAMDSWFQHNLLICPVFHGRTCLSGYCKFTGTFDDAFYVLVAYHNPIYCLTNIFDHSKKIEDAFKCMKLEDEVPASASYQLNSLTHKVFQALLLDIDIENVESKKIFLENIKTSIERITGLPMSKAELKTICELDKNLKEKLVQLIFKVASEIAIGCSRDYALLKEFPYSLRDVVNSSEYISKNLERIANQVQ